MFCWLCMGGPAEHPGSTDTHIAQCNSLADVERKGRMAQYEAGKAPIVQEKEEDKEWLKYHKKGYRE